MKCSLKRNVVWLESLPTADNVAATILLLGGDGHLVPVPASLLLAVSPLVRSILAEHLPPAFNQSCISLPSVTEDFLKVFKDLLSTGEAADIENIQEEVRQVFELLGVSALLVSCHSDSVNLGKVLDVKVNNVAGVTAKVETLPTEREYREKESPRIQKNVMAFSKIVNSSVFKDIDNVAGTPAFEIKVEPEVGYLVNDCVQIIEEVPRKCSECKYACYDKAELKTHCSITGHMGHKACKQCDYIATSKEELFMHKKKVHIPVERLFECGDCSWVGKNLHYLRNHAHSRHHRTKHDYEAAALAKAETLGSKAVAKYHKSLANSIKRAKKNH